MDGVSSRLAWSLWVVQEVWDGVLESDVCSHRHQRRMDPPGLDTGLARPRCTRRVFALACAAALTVNCLTHPPHRHNLPRPNQSRHNQSRHNRRRPPQPQAAAPVNQVPPSMLQQPAGEAQVVFSGDTLSIRADNSSLAAILHQVAGKSGMKIEGLSGDERVFGTFGPGAPRDVLADLLNGTAYNLVLLGDLGDGAPRELILTPATRAGAALRHRPLRRLLSMRRPMNRTLKFRPPQPEVPPAGTTPPPTPGVKTPQQLFEQLQRMRSAQQQQGATQDPRSSSSRSSNNLHSSIEDPCSVYRSLSG